MKRISSTVLLYGIGIMVGIGASVTMLLPATAAADSCISKGQLTTSNGTCCPSGQTQIASGQVSCNTADQCNGNIANDKAMSCLLGKYINPTITLLSALVGLAVVITIIRGALMYTSSGGDPSKAAAGKQHIINALIGLVAYLLLYVFLQFIIPGGILN